MQLVDGEIQFSRSLVSRIIPSGIVKLGTAIATLGDTITTIIGKTLRE